MGVEEPFVIHDIRRTVRTRLSQLRVRSEVAEMVIGHGKKGLARVYDQHQYLDEMREALDLWARELLRIAHGGDSEPRPETSGVNPEAAQSA
jgi:integrase